MPEFKFAPSIVKRAIGGRVNTGAGSPTSHAIAGSTAALVGPYGSVFDPARNGWDVDEVMRRGLERVIWVFRCVDAIASNQSKLHMVVRQGDPLEGPIVKDVNLFNLLNMRTNDYETSMQWRYRLSGQLLLSKRGAFIEVERDAFGIPVALHLLPPSHVEPIPHKDKFVDGYRLTMGDGSYRDLPNEKVIWLRLKPHPIDPYAQLTPMTAAGLAMETDWLARLFNANFLRNDGRPGLVIGIKGKTNPQDAKEIRDRFGSGGPSRAGRVSVIEADDIVVQDLGANPHDLQYLQTIAGSKEDILLAFGVSESVLGNASGRTFDNADAELEGFWSETMTSHCDPMARGLDDLTGSTTDNKFVSFDYNRVAVLQRHKQAKLDKALANFQAGTMTLDEYFIEIGKEPWDVPASRVIYLSNGVVVARDQEDQDAVDKLLPQPIIPAIMAGALAQGGQPPVGGAPGQPQLPGAQPPVGQGQPAISQNPQQVPAGFQDMIANRARQLALTARASKGYTPVRPRVQVIERKEGHPYETIRERYEGMFNGAIEVWSVQQADFFTDRLDTTSVRRNTRHWSVDDSTEIVGVKALDPSKVVDDKRWTGDLVRGMSSMMSKVVFRAIKDSATQMDNMGVLRVMNANGLGSTQGRTKAARVYGTTEAMETAVTDLLTPLNWVVEQAATAQLARIKEKIATLDADGKSMAFIKREVASAAGRNSDWRSNLARFLTTSLVEGAQYKTWSQAGDLVDHTWNTVEDEKVRHTHREIDGTTIPIGVDFKVGGEHAPYPAYHGLSMKEKAGCRCWTGYAISDKGAGAYDRLAS